VEPNGGTPISGTLAAIHDTVASLQGRTALLLATDGGPNCNGEATCTASDCILNIEDYVLNEKACTPDYNCCDPSIPNGPGGWDCVDAAATIAEVQRLKQKGIRTYVVGIPGSSYYANVLDQLATVGGTARPDSPKYYRVDDVTALNDVLLQIGTHVLITCDFMLDTEPPDPNQVNVYLDTTVVPYDAENGWTWTDSTRLSLHGTACDKLESGLVGQVQVVYGCPTELPK
jgi:hypothetical protein